MSNEGLRAPFRRIVTGHDAHGRAVILEDAPPPRVARIGGEEFAVLLPGTDEETAAPSHIQITLDKKTLNTLVAECFRRLGSESTVAFLDRLKDIGFQYATQAGITIGIDDLHVPPEKAQIIERATEQVREILQDYSEGVITDNTEELTPVVQTGLDGVFVCFEVCATDSDCALGSDCTEVLRTDGLTDFICIPD